MIGGYQTTSYTSLVVIKQTTIYIRLLVNVQPAAQDWWLLHNQVHKLCGSFTTSYTRLVVIIQPAKQDY